VAADRGDVLLIVSAALMGSVKLPVVVSCDESVTVTEKETEVAPAGGVPDRKPAALSVSQAGNPVADQV
jgi:hypothetical protein